MERVGGELERLCCSPAGSLMKWSDFLVCSSQLLSPQSQDIWPWLFVLLGLPYLQMTERTRKNKSKASGVLFSPTAWECKRLSICCRPYSRQGAALIMLAKNQHAMKDWKIEYWNTGILLKCLPIQHLGISFPDPLLCFCSFVLLFLRFVKRNLINI